MSRASEIATILESRIARITVANGFNTDISTHIFRGKRGLDRDADLPCVVMVEGIDNPKSDDSLAACLIEQNYMFEAHATCDPNHPNDTAHLIIADLKRAIFEGEPKHGMRLEGKAKHMTYRGRAFGVKEDGAGMVFAAVHIAVTYVEDLTNP